MLVIVFLGFGVLIGRAARNSVQQAALADASAPLKVVVAPRVASPATTAQAPASEEAPPAEEAPTPEPSPSPSTTSALAPAAPTATTPAAKPKTAPAKAPTTLPAIKHVFVVVLSDQPYAAVFGPESKARYLVGQLEPKGTILSRYDAIAHEELPNEVALVSGQGPTLQTSADCPSYAAIEPGTVGSDGQVLGEGWCTRPRCRRSRESSNRTICVGRPIWKGSPKDPPRWLPARIRPLGRPTPRRPQRGPWWPPEPPAPTRPTAIRSPTSSRSPALVPAPARRPASAG